MIPVLFNTLLFLIPLVFYKNTSELFELNKIVTLYTFTTCIVATWIINSIKTGKIIFRKSLLDIPLVCYLVVLLISSLLSIDSRTSFLGYYGRFNGGLLSQVCYALLYWAFVSNMNAKTAKQSLLFALYSLLIASILAIGEHFGIFATCGLMNLGWSESCWVQDVQNRVYSTLGQPNWLAAVITALIPVTWYFAINKNQFSKTFWFLVSVIFFITLLFTKSRSGLLATGIGYTIFWGFVYFKSKFKTLKNFILLSLSFAVLMFLFWFPKNKVVDPPVNIQGNSLEVGGTESGTIRKFVWLGAYEIFKSHPIIGSGPETFAFSFPKFKPQEHNLTSEWDFVYNKAHNEFLNYLANTGILGFAAYISIIVCSLIVMFKSKRFDLLAGYIGILVTNFFGFSVVPTSLLFFLFPAITIAMNTESPTLILDRKQNKLIKLKTNQWILIASVLFLMLYILNSIYLYWRADIHYNQARINNDADQISKALLISPNEPNYLSELAFIISDTKTSLKALALNPNNQNTRKVLIGNLVKNPENLQVAENILLEAITISPNDPRNYYQLGILQLKMDKTEDSVKNLEKSVYLKPNYKEGRFALGLTYKALGNKVKAIEHLEYILENIDPKDELTKKYLDELI